SSCTMPARMRSWSAVVSPSRLRMYSVTSSATWTVKAMSPSSLGIANGPKDLLARLEPTLADLLGAPFDEGRVDLRRLPFRQPGPVVEPGLDRQHPPLRRGRRLPGGRHLVGGRAQFGRAVPEPVGEFGDRQAG